MATKNYPRMPIKNWWVLRHKFKQSIPPQISSNYLSTLLGIGEGAAKNLLAPLKAVGLIDQDGKTTERANHWRVDDEYPQICQEIKQEIYPEELLHLVPDPEADYDSAINWFMRDTGVGQTAAKQMAHFYQMLSKADPSDGAETKTKRPSKRTKPTQKKQEKEQPEVAKEKISETPSVAEIAYPQTNSPITGPSLHIDIQLHISPETSADQIDQIFASMAKHLSKFIPQSKATE